MSKLAPCRANKTEAGVLEKESMGTKNHARRVHRGMLTIEVEETMRILPLEEVRPPCALWEESSNVSPMIELRKLRLGLWTRRREKPSHRMK